MKCPSCEREIGYFPPSKEGEKYKGAMIRCWRMGSTREIKEGER